MSCYGSPRLIQICPCEVRDLDYSSSGRIVSAYPPRKADKQTDFSKFGWRKGAEMLRVEVRNRLPPYTMCHTSIGFVPSRIGTVEPKFCQRSTKAAFSFPISEDIWVLLNWLSNRSVFGNLTGERKNIHF